MNSETGEILALSTGALVGVALITNGVKKEYYRRAKNSSLSKSCSNTQKSETIANTSDEKKADTQPKPKKTRSKATIKAVSKPAKPKTMLTATSPKPKRKKRKVNQSSVNVVRMRGL